MAMPERETFFTAGKNAPGNASRPLIQTKLTIGQPGDKYEQEADQVADQVVQRLAQPEAITPNPTAEKPIAPKLQLKAAPAPAASQSSATPSVQTKCAECEKEEKEQLEGAEALPAVQKKPIFESEANNGALQMKCAACEAEEETLQPKSDGVEAPAASSSLESRLQSSKGGGSPLPENTRSQMEGAIGADFSGVRVHTNSSAVQMNKELGAQAFTHGSDVYFNAGKYDTGSTEGQRLLGHELTHVVQQGGESRQKQISNEEKKEIPQLKTDKEYIQQYSWSEFVDDVTSPVESTWDRATELGRSAYDTAIDVADTAIDTAVGIGERAIYTARNIGGSIYDTAISAVNIATETVSGVLDWLATEAGQRIQAFVDRFGGVISITSSGLVITLPRFCPIPALAHQVDIEPISGDKTVPLFAIPIGPDLFISGEVGVTGTIAPEFQAQIGPICLEGVRMVINPFSHHYGISGSVSATVAGSLGAEARGGLIGQLSLMAIVPVGPVPVPISVPLTSIEGGVAVMLRGIGTTKWTIGGGLEYGGGAINVGGFSTLELGLAGDAFLGAYGQISLLGENLCRIYWQPFEWHNQIAATLGIGSNLTIVPGGSSPGVGLSIGGYLGLSPFENFDLAISREGFKDDCPLIETICDILRVFHKLPSQNNGTWANYGAGNRLEGPLEVYERRPQRASGSMCRGACGPDCDTCKSSPFFVYTDPLSGEVWRYTHFRICDTHEGCREHDAAFDWAADAHGETGPLAIIMPAHMAGNIECACNFPALNCAGWIKGMRPHDGVMLFADMAERASSGISSQPGRGGQPPFGEQGEDFYHYSKNPPAGDFRRGGERWTTYHTNCAAEASAATGVPLPLNYISSIGFGRAINYINVNDFQTRWFNSIITGIYTPANHYRNHQSIPENDYTTQRLTIFSRDCDASSNGNFPTNNNQLPPGQGGETPSQQNLPNQGGGTGDRFNSNSSGQGVTNPTGTNIDLDRVADFSRFQRYGEVLPSSGWLFGEEGIQTTTASNLIELGRASLLNYDIVYLVGNLLSQIRRDPRMVATEEAILRRLRSDDRFGSQLFYATGTELVGFGGDRWTSPNEDWGSIGEDNPLTHVETWQVAGNELTWALRNATVRYWAEVDAMGNITITYRLNDRLDLSPSPGRREAYNNISRVLGFFYHDLAGGNINLQTRAEWVSRR